MDKLKNVMGTAQVFYLFGHGAGAFGPADDSQIPRSTVFGNFDSQHGNHFRFYATNVIFSLRYDDVIVPKCVGSHPYVFAWNDSCWNDSCNSAGGNSTTGQIGTEDDVWATAFNAATFIGSNGFTIINNSGATDVSPWYNWRKKFWENLATGEDVYDSYLDCWPIHGAVNTTQYYSYYFRGSTTYSCTPGDGYGSNPRVVLYGDPLGTTLVPQ